MFERLKQEPTIFMFKKMWKYSEGMHGKLVFMWALLSTGRLIWMLPPFLFGMLLNEIQKNGISDTNIYLVCGLLFSIFLADTGAWLFHAPGRIMENIAAYKIDRNYKKYLYNAVLSLPLTWHSDHDSGNTIDKVNKATDAIWQFCKHTFIVWAVIIKIVATTIILSQINIYIAVLAILFLVFAIYVLVKFDKILIPQYTKLNEFDNKSQAKVYDALSNVTTVKVLGIEKAVQQSIIDSWWLSFKDYVTNKKIQEAKWMFGGWVFDLLVFAPILFYILYNYRTGDVILVGTISMLYMYLKDFVEVYYSIAGTYDEISIQKSRVLGVKDIEDNFAKINKIKKKNFDEWQNLEILNLNFKYDETIESNSLNFKNFKIKKGEKVALIGESGSGKSTLLKVLHGMYEKVKSETVVDGKKVKTNFQDVNFNTTLVPQEPEVFSASIKENITLLLNFTDEDIYRACRMAEFDEVVESLPKKFESVVNEKGVNLSGGQKQRLALSRALLFSHDKEIILLDESTSSVDPVNEVKIYKNIFENFPGVTILATIHKMNLLKYFDRIVVLEKGEVKIEGTFEYVYENDLEFKNSWDEFVKENNLV